MLREIHAVMYDPLTRGFSTNELKEKVPGLISCGEWKEDEKGESYTKIIYLDCLKHWAHKALNELGLTYQHQPWPEIPLDKDYIYSNSRFLSFGMCLKHLSPPLRDCIKTDLQAFLHQH